MNTLGNLLDWSLQASFVLLILFACYYLLFRNSTVLKLRRSILIGLIIISALSPIVELPKNKVTSQMSFLRVSFNDDPQAEFTTPASTSALSSSDNASEGRSELYFSRNDYFSMAYAIGIVASLGLLIFQFSKVVRLTYKGTKGRFSGITLFKHNSIKSPFSFLKWAFIPDRTYEPQSWELLMSHEAAHLQQRHSLDILFTRLFTALTWYNPAIYLLQKELQLVHELQADEQVLQKSTASQYAATLLAFRFNIGHQLTQPFSLKTSLIKRISHMKKQKTRPINTLISCSLILTLSLGLLGVQSSDKTQLLNRNNSNSYDRMNEYFQFLIRNEISTKHEKVLIRLKEEYPNEDILIRYVTSPKDLDYQYYSSGLAKPLYFGELEQEDKDEIFNNTLINADTKKLARIAFSKKDGEKFTLTQIKDEIKSYMDRTDLFVVFHYPVEFDEKVYSLNEVDVAPEPAGGLEPFEKAIALDNSLPKNLDPEKLPETIEFSAVIDPHSLSSLLLVTELEGNEEENLPYYRFFGELLKDINEKSRTFYRWKLGRIDGKEVKTKVKISIPTKYMK